MIRRNIAAFKVLPVTLVCLSLLSGCGGEEEEAELTFTPTDNASQCNLAILFMASPSDVCPSSSSSSSSGSSAPTDPFSPIPGSTTPSSTASLVVRSNYEFEPNNDLGNANVLDFARSDKRVGAAAYGSVDDRIDIEDSFTFARSSAATFNIELCPPDLQICNRETPIDTGTAFFEIIDQNGRILRSSADTGRNVLSFDVDAGITYYLRVVAGDTMGGQVDYALTTWEAF